VLKEFFAQNIACQPDGIPRRFSSFESDSFISLSERPWLESYLLRKYELAFRKMGRRTSF
jgi:hypothetical protein